MAGFFGFLDYSRPGKGVRKDEPKRSHFAQFFVLVQRKFWKLIQLNLLFILFCVPVVTIGASVSAMTYVLRNFANERPVFLLSDFWDAFKSNFKQSLLFELFAAAMIITMAISWNFYSVRTADSAWLYLPLGMVSLVLILSLFASFYIPLMIVTLKLPFKAILKNAFIMSILCIKSNLITLFFVALFMFALWNISLYGDLLYVIIGFSFIGFIIVHNSYRGIKKYAIDPYLEANSGADAENDDGNSVFADEQMES